MRRLNVRLRLVSVVLLAAAAAWVFVGEVGAFYYRSLAWRWPETSSSGGKESLPALRLLVLSDPHIQCSLSKYEPWIARWDSDRFVRRAFSLLMRRLEPDVVIVLGDLFAEGFKASEREWRDYLKCMNDVLPIPEGVEFVVVPGDNDIGGEGKDAMNEEVNRRYTAEFGEMNHALDVKGIRLIKVNTVSLIHSSPAGAVESAAQQDLKHFIQTIPYSNQPDVPMATIVLSHVPLNDIHGAALKAELLSAVSPDLVLSGHTHHPATVVHSYSRKGGGARDQSVMEVTVPTCSYRMGEVHMGVGAVTIDAEGRTHYSLLWLPQRYPFLLSYVVLAVLAMAAVTVVCLRGRQLARW